MKTWRTPFNWFLLFNLWLLPFMPTNPVLAQTRGPGGDKNALAFTISVNKAGQVIVDNVNPALAPAVDNIHVQVMVLAAQDMPPATEASTSVWCPWGGTGAAQLGNGWFYNPYPDMDFYIDYKVPKTATEYTVCITTALWAALQASGRPLLIFRYNYDAAHWRDRIVIGSSAVRTTCQNLTGNPNCADWLLSQQAEIRYNP